MTYDVALIATAGNMNASDMSRTSRFLSSPLMQLVMSSVPFRMYLQHLVSNASRIDNAFAELVRIQSASSIRDGPVRALAPVFAQLGRQMQKCAKDGAGGRVLLVWGTSDGVGAVPLCCARAIADRRRDRAVGDARRRRARPDGDARRRDRGGARGLFSLRRREAIALPLTHCSSAVPAGYQPRLHALSTTVVARSTAEDTAQRRHTTSAHQRTRNLHFPAGAGVCPWSLLASLTRPGYTS